jgi:diguanylate cyclase (GGDEF)-like protein
MPDEHRTAVPRELQRLTAMLLGFGKLLGRGERTPDQVRELAAEIERGAREIAVLLKQLAASASGGLPPVAGDPESADLVRRLTSAERRSTSLETQLAEAQLDQRQLQAYADDFRSTYVEARRRLQQMTVLYEVSSAISATVDANEVLARTTEGLGRLLPGDCLGIYLLDEEDDRQGRRETLHCPQGEPAPPERVTLGEGPLGRCLASGLAVLEGPMTGSPQGGASISTLALPLSVGAERLGALLLLRAGERPIPDEDQHLAEMVVSQASMALQNARLVTTDALTGLYNRRYFDKALEFECERARRVHRPLGLVMVDIDHFKRFNDRFGHPAGDEVLRLVATTLANQLRRTDIVARIGGEEFAAILAEDDRQSIKVAAERLRRAVEQAPPLLFEGRELPGVRVSIGGASLSPEKVNSELLLSSADRALRQAKRRGRNRSTIAKAS